MNSLKRFTKDLYRKVIFLTILIIYFLTSQIYTYFKDNFLNDFDLKCLYLVF